MSSGALPKISARGTATEIRMVQNLLSRQYRAEQSCPRAASIQPTTVENMALRARAPRSTPVEDGS